MRRHRIRALAGRRFRPCTTDSRHYLPIVPNLLAQRFVATAPNKTWFADITYIATGEGWLHLAAGRPGDRNIDRVHLSERRFLISTARLLFRSVAMTD